MWNVLKYRKTIAFKKEKPNRRLYKSYHYGRAVSFHPLLAIAAINIKQNAIHSFRSGAFTIFALIFWPSIVHSWSQGQRGHALTKFLDNIVILCFERRFSKLNSVIRLKSNILALPKFLSPPKFLGWLHHCNCLAKKAFKNVVFVKKIYSGYSYTLAHLASPSGKSLWRTLHHLAVSHCGVPCII